MTVSEFMQNSIGLWELTDTNKLLIERVGHSYIIDENEKFTEIWINSRIIDNNIVFDIPGYYDMCYLISLDIAKMVFSVVENSKPRIIELNKLIPSLSLKTDLSHFLL